MIKLKPYHQAKEGFCGPVVLKIVMDYFGVPASEEELAKLANTDERWGTSIDGMAAAAKHFGFDVFYKEDATIEELKEYVLEKNVPVIVRWFFEDEGHYSIVVDVTEKNIVMVDPLHKIFRVIKKRVMPIEKFSKAWFDLAESERRESLPREIVRNFMMVLTPSAPR
jgi:ABC-type bacteriocin/lantibiotic exporter with double-glycine peptidase domain